MGTEKNAEQSGDNGKLRIIVMIAQLAVAGARLAVAIFWPECPYRPHF
ncbi:hypothetical protein [Actinomycetospora soli]|nr:hypothetical protein [Actinomycetospora soli]MCD2191341.1 hypothetical protein [Actinomycetospora soli]